MPMGSLIFAGVAECRILLARLFCGLVLVSLRRDRRL
jgi:hypothetical protein